jgi:glycerophosphoryl diester phosphodiesterase
MNRILTALCLLWAQQSAAIEIIAHRGYACDALENSVKSVQNAWVAGADGVELDLRISKDGVIFLYHDDTINGRSIARTNYEEVVESRQSDAPTLEKILGLRDPPGYLVLDLKDSGPGRYEQLPSLIGASGIDEDRIVIQSADMDSLAMLGERMPEARLVYLSHLKRSFPFFRAPRPERIIAMLEGHDIDGVSLKGRKFINEDFVEKIKAAGFLVNVWTINEMDRAIYYRDIGVDGLITDYVEDLRAELVNGVHFNGRCSNDVQDAS